MTKKELINTLAGMIDDGRCSEAGSTEREVQRLLDDYVRNYSVVAAELLIRRDYVDRLGEDTSPLVALTIREAFIAP